MEIEIRLKKILEERKCWRRGVLQEIADYAKCHRHTIARLCRSEPANTSLEVLGAVCDWLVEHAKVPRETLPQVLFGVRPLSLWEAVAKPHERARPGATAQQRTVTIYLGEYQMDEGPLRTRFWVSRRDAAVATDIVLYLSTPGSLPDPRPRVDIEYVPFHFTVKAPLPPERQFWDDVLRAKGIFASMRPGRAEGRSGATAIMVGSTRVNYLVELFVADLFGVEPFTPVAEPGRVPFYMVYRGEEEKRERDVPSCFGGAAGPPGMEGDTRPGTWFRRPDGGWEFLPWRRHADDSGLVILRRDYESETLEMAVFGYSGRGTAVMGHLAIHKADRFWPPGVRVPGTTEEVGVFVCGFRLKGDSEDAGGAYEEPTLRVVPLGPEVLGPALAHGRRPAGKNVQEKPRGVH